MTERDLYLEHYVKTKTYLKNFNPIEMTKTFGENVARLRTEKQFTQDELAKMIQISKSTLVRIELGLIRHVDMVIAMKLAGFFNVPLMSMVGQSTGLVERYSTLMNSSPRTQRLVECILAVDEQISGHMTPYDSRDMITKIGFGEPVRDGLNITRFLFEQDNLSEYHDFPWYREACALVEINSAKYRPMFHVGDRLVVSERPPENGEVCIFIRDDQLYLRRFVEYGDQAYLEPVYTTYTSMHKDHVIDRRNRDDLNSYVRFGTVVAVI